MSEYEAGLAGGQALVEGQEVVYRVSRRYRRPMLGRFAALAVLTALFAISGLAAVQVLAWVSGPLAAIFGVLYLWQGRFATKVTGRGIEVHGYLNHFVPWAEVRDIEVTSFGAGRLPQDQDFGGQVYWGSRVRGSSLGPGARVRARRVSPNRMAHLASIKLVRANGRKLRLRAPVVAGWASDPDFTDKARQLEQLCTRYGRGAIG